MTRRLRRVVIHVFAWALAVGWLFPFVGLAMAAFRPLPEIIGGWWNFNRFTPTLENFPNAFDEISAGLGNSLLIAVPGTLIPMFVATLAGYGFARFSFPIRDYLFLTIVLLMTIPQQMVALPIFRIMLGLGLVNSVLSIVLLHSAWGLPWIILFMRNYISALPKEVEEAARVDGASDLKVFFKIVLPMTLPALGAVAVLQFMWVWNDFFFALILCPADPTCMPATVAIIRTIGQFQFNPGLLAAGSLLVMSVPVLLYVLLQRYYIRGMIGWTIKG
jgi:multiple sugar transport system permease protein